MASAGSTKSELTSLEKQITTRCKMYGYYDKNIKEAIKKLDEIKERGRDAQAKKSPVFLLVPKDDELEEEAYNLDSRGLKYVFAVEEKPRFSWEGLLVFCLGLLQIIGGALLAAFTFGTLAQVGIGMITEGVSDCISGIEAMATGIFSWTSWAIDKAISIGVSLLSFGIGKLVSKGFKACKMLIKGLGKDLKALPKFFSRQAKDTFSVVTKTNMKNAAKLATKKIAEEVAMYGLGKVEEEILKNILDEIKRKVTEGIADDVRSRMEKKPLNELVDSIILSHIVDKDQLHDLLEDKDRRSDLLAIFRQLSNSALQPFYEDLTWQKKINSILISVTDAAKAEAKGKVRLILNAIQVTHHLILVGDAIQAAVGLSAKFFSNLQEQLKIFKEEKGFSEKVKINELTPSGTEMLKAFKEELTKAISALISDALVEVFHQKFSSHIVSRVQGTVNGSLRQHLRSGLKTDRTYEKLRAGQNNSYIAYMPGSQSSNPGQCSKSHAENIKNPKTAGTILDVRVLSEATGTKVVILIEDKHGRLNKMQEVNPSTKPSAQTVTLIYRPKSSQYPDGHYDVSIDNKTVQIDSKDNNCLFHAFSRGLKPKANEEEIVSEAERLRLLESETLLKQPGQWEPFIERKELTERIRGGDWYLAEGAVRKLKTKEEKDTFKKTVGKTGKYKSLMYENRKKDMGQFINADHQPPVQSILDARKFNQNSTLANAMLEVATNSSPLDQNLLPKVKERHGRELPTVNVPTEMHRDFLSTKSKSYRELVAKTISKDDVVGTFKLTILGSMPRFMLNPNKGFKNFKNDSDSKLKLDTFDKSFKEHSEKIVEHWFDRLGGKGVMSQQDCNDIRTWINNKGYSNQNDPYRNQVVTFLT